MSTDRVLVTGATGTLGRAVVERFSQAGATVGIHYRNDESTAKQLVDKFGGSTLKADFDVAEVEEVCRTLVQDFPANIFILNASSQDVVAWDDLTIESFDAMYRNSLRANMALLLEAARHLKSSLYDNKVIVVIGSIEGIRPAHNHAAYATMKAALHHAATAAAHELGAFGIRVVAIAPGLIYREGLEKDWPEGVARWNAASALGRPVTAAEVADVIFDVTHQSALTGVTIPVDAGWSASPSW